MWDEPQFGASLHRQSTGTTGALMK